ncbi:MAG: SPFH domain-containing protein, partial [Planctomycetota bacterium]
NAERGEKRLREIIFNETSEAISELTFNDLISTDGEAVRSNFDDLEEEIIEEVRDSVAGYGLQVDDFGIRRIAIPESTTREVFNRMRAERQKVAESYLAEGESEKRTIVAEANNEAENTLSDAESEAKNIRSEGEAAEAKYYDEFAQQPELAIFLRRLEALRKIAEKARDADRPITFVLDPKTEPFSVLSRGAQEREDISEDEDLDVQVEDEASSDNDTQEAGN